MVNEKDARISNLLRLVMRDLGVGIFADGKVAAKTLAAMFPEDLQVESEVLQRALSTGALEFLANPDRYNYADYRNAARYILAEYEFFNKDWAWRIMTWFDGALEANAVRQENAVTQQENTGHLSPVDAILDENYTGNIVLYNGNNEPVEFEQVAVVPMEGKIYVILKPAQDMAGVEADEALVFLIDEYEDAPCLVAAEEDAVVDAVFEQYYQMLRDAGVDVEE